MGSQHAMGRRSGAVRGLAACVVALAGWLPARVARAGDAVASTDAAPGIAVHIGSVPAGGSVAIETDEGNAADHLVTQCFDDCETIVDPGPYRLRLVGPSGQLVGTKTVSIHRPVAFHVVGGDPGAANTGLVLGITGAVIAVTGVAALASLALDSMCEAPNCGGDARPFVVYALIAIPVGAIMTSIGWGMFAHNRRLFRSEYVEERRDRRKGKDRRNDVDPDSRAAPLPFQVGIVPTPGGLTAGLRFSF